MWPSVCSCSVTAATSAGWAWPSALTAMPPSRSTYSLPSVVPDVGALAADQRELGRAEGVHQAGGVPLLEARHDCVPCDVPRLPGLGLDAGQHLGADALLGEQLEQHGVRLAAVDDRGAGYAAARRRRRQAAILGIIPASRLGRISASASGLISPTTSCDVGPVEEEPLDVGEDEQLLGAERDRQRGGRRVGVDVVHDAVDVGRDAGDDRDPAGLDEVEHRLGAHLRRPRRPGRGRPPRRRRRCWSAWR